MILFFSLVFTLEFFVSLSVFRFGNSTVVHSGEVSKLIVQNMTKNLKLAPTIKVYKNKNVSAPVREPRSR